MCSMVSPNLKQTCCMAGVIINMLAQGMSLSYSSVLLPGILATDSDIATDLNVASWIASCAAFSAVVGPLVSSIIMDLYGRKVAHIAFTIPGILGWILTYFAINIPMLIAGRVFCGLSTSSTITLGAIVVGEYTSSKNRGTFLSLNTAAICFGSIMTHICGYYLSWRLVALVAVAPGAVAVLISFTWPESPAWLIFKGRFEWCEKSFYWLRGTSDESKREFQALVQARKEGTDHLAPLSMSKKVLTVFKKLTNRNFSRLMTIMLFAIATMESCGKHFFPAYAFQIIGQVSGNRVHSFYYILAIDFTTLASTIYSSYLVRVVKRRTLLFGTGLPALLILACVCSYLYLVTYGIISKDRPLIPVVLLGLYFVLTNLGCSPIPITLLGEIFPLSYRGVGMAMCGIMLTISNMIFMKMTPHLLDILKVSGTFAVSGSVLGISLLVLFFILPEFKDRSFREIENYFSCGKFTDISTDYEDRAKTKEIPDTYRMRF